MDLGSFSVSLAVRDIEASKAFYEKLGFTSIGGDCGQGWTILKNGDHVIGLFQGMFDRNMLTFNPGWNQAAQNVDEFTDVRELRKRCEQAGLSIEEGHTPGDTGPGSFVVRDPDGNPILIDQHR